MSSPFDLIESDEWPAIRARIGNERVRRVEGLLRVGSLESLRLQQGFIEALDWVLEEAKPKPAPPPDDDDGC